MSDYAEVYFYDSNNLSGNFPDLPSVHIMIHKHKGSQIVQPEDLDLQERIIKKQLRELREKLT